MRPSYVVVHEDRCLLVVDKAAGVLTVPPPGSRQRCLLDDLRRDGHRVAPVHRLDQETSGLLVLSLDPATRRDLEDQFRSHEVRKEYLAVVVGIPSARRAVIDVPLTDTGKSARVDRRGRRAVTRYEVLETYSAGAALVRAELETGRHNQVRLHFAHLGHPLLGDRKFARGRAPGLPSARRTLLHAERLVLRHPATGETLDLRAPLPADLSVCLERLRATDRRARGPGRSRPGRDRPQ